MSGWLSRYVAAGCTSLSIAVRTVTPLSVAPKLIPPAPANRSIPCKVSARFYDDTYKMDYHFGVVRKGGG